MENFACYYCNSSYDDFMDMIDHTIPEHGNQMLKIYYLQVNEGDRKFRYQSKDYKVLLNDVLSTATRIPGNPDINLVLI